MREQRMELKRRWSGYTFYQRFEALIALVLTVVISLVIAVALYRLVVGVITGLVLGVLNPLEHEVFQEVFGEIMTLLIALEFNHTLVSVVKREQSIIQVKTVILVALLAIARKFIILDLRSTSATEMGSLAAITLVLGITYWLMRERDDRLLQTSSAESPGKPGD